MSHISDLIETLCPEGVHYFELRQLFDVRNGYTPSKLDLSLWTDGTIPWFRMEDIRAGGGVLNDAIQHVPESAVKGGRLFAANSILIATSATIGVHALVTVPHLSNQRFTSLSLKPEYESILNIKFIYYYCFILDEWCRNHTTISSFASVDMTAFKSFCFPVPPLEIQREIVRVLDLFSELDAELNVELEARRVQFAYYREELTGGGATTARVPMGQLGEFARGRRFTKSDFVEHGIPGIHYGEIYTTYGTTAKKVVSQIRADLGPQLRFAQPGDVVIAGVGETVEEVGKAVAWVGDEPVAIHDDTFLFRSSMNPKFVSFALQTVNFHRQKDKYVARAKVKRLSSVGLAAITLPVPALEEQARTVAILENFDALANDLTFGIPAEIAARRRQYEYYRDKLLTFEEAPE